MWNGVTAIQWQHHRGYHPHKHFLLPLPPQIIISNLLKLHQIWWFSWLILSLSPEFSLAPSLYNASSFPLPKMLLLPPMLLMKHIKSSAITLLDHRSSKRLKGETNVINVCPSIALQVNHPAWNLTALVSNLSL